MFSSKNYSEMTLDELVSEETNLKSQRSYTPAFNGALAGIAVSSIFRKKFFMPAVLLIVAVTVGLQLSKNLKRIQSEIKHRERLRQLT
jgi:hypothetical protein